MLKISIRPFTKITSDIIQQCVSTIIKKTVMHLVKNIYKKLCDIYCQSNRPTESGGR